LFDYNLKKVIQTKIHCISTALLKGLNILLTIVNQIATNKNFILIGTGFGAFKTSNPSTFRVNRPPKADEGVIPMVAVCDENGQIKWMKTNEIKIVNIDGNLPINILNDN